ncbi:uncharacterized protein PV06_04229 [Exophiala oligosperma]|uniref:Uncharacterized protein n=2 Tax=Chaetothyriales TaxID=34395 RepID=A0A0D2E5L2_9EURO|nr:uncharacterized protein PV06_04229 [Exophiala oligosperma]KAJ9646974.1 hypothetical protein H2204_000666 [Knufia peltigerae]KIW43084.1 hypothetical protein PV06_04229 [Exophiala oligosperma]
MAAEANNNNNQPAQEEEKKEPEPPKKPHDLPNSWDPDHEDYLWNPDRWESPINKWRCWKYDQEARDYIDRTNKADAHIADLQKRLKDLTGYDY